MINKLLIRIGIFFAIILAIISVGWLIFEFAYKGSLTIEQPGDNLNVKITDQKGQIVSSGQQASLRMLPGTYNITATNNTSGISQAVTINPLTNVKITMPNQPLLKSMPLAKAPLYGAFSSEDVVIGVSPLNNFIYRIDQIGNPTRVLTSNNLAGHEGQKEPEIGDIISTYQPYKEDKVLVSSNGILYVADKKAVKEISTEGIQITKESTIPKFLIATRAGADDFMVGYKQDVYYYKDTNAKPQKIFTAPKKFDSLIYGQNTIGLYYSNVITANQDISSLYSDYQTDLLIVNTSTNEQQTIKGIINNATLNPNGELLTVQPRGDQAYLQNLKDKKRQTYIPAPLIAGPVWLDDSSYIYGKKDSVWQYNTKDQSSVLLGNLPNDVTFVRKESASNGGGYIATTYTNEKDAVIYRLGGKAEADNKYDKIRSAVPYKTVNYSINFTNVGPPTLLIETYAPLNSGSQINRYNQETLQYRQDALNYLKDQGLDITGINVIYAPSDPL